MKVDLKGEDILFYLFMFAVTVLGGMVAAVAFRWLYLVLINMTMAPY